MALDTFPTPEVAGMQAPLTAAAWRAAEICRLRSEPYLAHHAARTYFWGTYLATIDGVEHDAERLWIAAMLHDLGLVHDAPATPCFEDVGADVAAGFLKGQGWEPEAVADVTDAIRLHMAFELPADASATARLLDAALSLDVSGRRYDELPAMVRQAVLERFPRLDFKRRFGDRLRQAALDRPGCTTAALMSGGLAARIAGAPWDE